MVPTLMQKSRMFLKDTIRKEIDFSKSDESRGYPEPPIEKPYDLRAKRVRLLTMTEWTGINPPDLISAIYNRNSRHAYLDRPLTLDQLSFLLWATQGIKEPIDGRLLYRTVPSAGARHALETYLFIFRAQDIAPGVYRYLPLEHELVLEFTENALPEKLVKASLRQEFLGSAGAVFVWTAVPSRMEWRYSLAAHRMILLDAGHVCQNLYLACEAIGAGTCAVAAYDQEAMDRLLRIDGEEEFVIYMAPVGLV
jgi:SagB-type dehydrogenase family enzyme